MNKFNLASFIVNKFPGDVTPMKLQKLLYYCYVWQLVAGEKHFQAKFSAWQHGPVDPDIYREYKKYGRDVIPTEKSDFMNVPAIFDFILDSYSVFSAFELSKTTHMEKPWKDSVKTGKNITDEDLVDFYKIQPFAKNFPVNNSKVFYPPKTSSHYSFTFDMDKDYVPVFDSIDEYLESFKLDKARFSSMVKNYAKQD